MYAPGNQPEPPNPLLESSKPKQHPRAIAFGIKVHYGRLDSLLTPLSRCFSHFPHGTYFLSELHVNNQALEGAYPLSSHRTIDLYYSSHMLKERRTMTSYATFTLYGTPIPRCLRKSCPARPYHTRVPHNSAAESPALDSGLGLGSVVHSQLLNRSPLIFVASLNYMLKFRECSARPK